MTLHKKPIKSAPQKLIAEGRRLTASPSSRLPLQFHLRTVFIVVLVICIVLSIGHYRLVRESHQGPVIRLQGNGSVSIDESVGLPLASELLSKALVQASERYWNPRQDGRWSKSPLPWSWEQLPGPLVTLVVAPEATHGALDTLLKACVQKGFYRFVLEDARDKKRKFSFGLFPDVHVEGLPDIDAPPPILVCLRATRAGRLSDVYLSGRRLNDLVELRESLTAMVGDERGPNSIRAIVQVHMICDNNLRLRHVLEALDAVTSHLTLDGERVTLLENVSPVCWGEPP